MKMIINVDAEKSRISTIIVLSLFTVVFFNATVASAEKSTLRFGIGPYYSPKKIHDGFNPLIKHVSKKLGRNVEIVVTKKYEDLERDVCNGKIDIGIFGAVSYVATKEKCPGIQYVATTQATKGGKKRSYYFSWFIAHKNSGLVKMKQLKGKTFTFVSKHSSSGYVFPIIYFKKRGIVPDSYFSKVVFAGSHSKVTDMIASGEIDAGATYDVNLWAAESKHGKIFRRLKKIGPILNLAVAATPGIDGALLQQVARVLINLPETVFNKDFPYTGFEALSDSDYDLTRDAVKLSK